MFAGNIDLDGIDAAEQRWIDSGITDYRFTYKLSCMCTQEAGAPWTVTVRNGQIESVENDDYGTPEQVIDLTPERIYELSRMAMGGGDTVVLSVNEYGFAVEGVVGVKSAAVDGGLDFRTSDFEVLS